MAALKTFIESRTFEWAITALIVINAITLGLETSPRVMAVAGDLLLTLDKLVLAVFVIELAVVEQHPVADVAFAPGRQVAEF